MSAEPKVCPLSSAATCLLQGGRNALTFILSPTALSYGHQLLQLACCFLFFRDHSSVCQLHLLGFRRSFIHPPSLGLSYHGCCLLDCNLDLQAVPTLTNFSSKTPPCPRHEGPARAPGRQQTHISARRPRVAGHLTANDLTDTHHRRQPHSLLISNSF